jgi:LacI family transcriptional regulator
LSVVGFDGSAIANLVHPTLTTMVQPTQELAAEAVRMIVDARTQTERKYLPFELRIGKSTAAISD